MHTQGPPAPKPGRRDFLVITHDQLAMPTASRGASRDGDRVSQLQWKVLCGLESLSWGGKRKCRAKDDEIADAIGLTGSDRARRNQVQIALHGRTYRKARWDPETGKWKRDGALVTAPGLCDPALGFVEILQLPTGERELVLTSKWLKYGRFQVYSGGNGEPREADPDPDPGGVPAIAVVSTAPPAGDGPTAPVGPPPPVASEAAETETAPAIAETETAPAIAEPATGAPTGEPAPAPVEQPSPEVLEEVLGNHAREPRPDQAWQLVERMALRGARFDLGDDESLKYEVNRGYDPLTGSEKSVIRWLKPQVVELLKARSEKSKSPPEAGEPPGGERPAPRVSKPTEIRAMIGKLMSQPAADDFDCQALAHRLATDPGFAYHDADPATSEATYLGLACDTKRAELPQAIMTEAFETACKPKVRKRGAMFVAEVKRLIQAGVRKPDREGGSTS
jgi:hypothetical protein